MRLVLNLVRPRYFVPIHGEYRQLAKHARLAEHLRIAGLEETFVLESGETLEIDHQGARKGGHGDGGPRLHRFGLAGRSGRGHGDSRPPPSFRRRHRAADHRHQQAHRRSAKGCRKSSAAASCRWKTARSSCRRRARWWRRRWKRPTSEETTDWGVMKEKIRADLKRYHHQADLAAAADHAGDSGGLRFRILNSEFQDDHH